MLGDASVHRGGASTEMPLLHVAADQGEAAGYNGAHFPYIRRFVAHASISVMSIDPQIMVVGQSHAELSASQTKFECGEVDWPGQERARVMASNNGSLRFYGERVTGKFLSAEMVGLRAEHLAHLIGMVVTEGYDSQRYD